MIEFNQVKKIFSVQEAIKEATFRIQQNEFVFLVGPSGAGKTTLLKMIYKAERPTNGEIHVFNKNVKKIRTATLRRNIGIVFQDYEKYLLKNKTAAENISYVLEAQGKSPFYAYRKALEAMERMGIRNKEKRFPYELSGGEKQRLAIARAVVNSPKILICDEPTGNLDSENANIVLSYLNKVNQEGTTIIMSTHNKEIIEKEKKRILNVQEGLVSERTNDFRKTLDLEGIMNNGKKGDD